jgi:hypothetical protein
MKGSEAMNPVSFFQLCPSIGLRRHKNRYFIKGGYNEMV